MRLLDRVVPLAIAILLVGAPAHSFAAGPTTKSPLRFEDTPWPDVLQWLAKELGLTLQMNDAPVGKFSYSDPKTFTPNEAFELIHTTLLDRGYTLVRQGGQLLVVLLADNLHWSLAPYVPLEEIADLPASQMITTTLKLNSLPGKEAAAELGPTLSPRGKIAGTTVGSRLAVCDQAGVVRQLIDLLAIMDPPRAGLALRLKVFKLRHASAGPTATLLHELIGPQSGPSPGGGSGNPLEGVMDFQNMGRQLFNRETLGSFVPGTSFKGVVADKPKKAAETRITVDRARNIVIVTGELEALALVSKIVTSLDVPASDQEGVPEASIRRYEIPAGNAADLGKQLATLFSADRGFLVSGSGTILVARGNEEQHARIEKILSRLKRSETKLMAFSVGNRDAESLVIQLDRLFNSDGAQNKPTFIADPVGRNILVRGTTRQIEEIRQFLEKGELRQKTP